MEGKKTIVFEDMDWQLQEAERPLMMKGWYCRCMPSPSVAAEHVPAGLLVSPPIGRSST